jgi:hypothetical protein
VKQVVYYYKIIFINGIKCDKTGLLHEGNMWQIQEKTNGKMVHKKPQTWGGGFKGTKWRLEIIYSHKSGEQHTVIILATWKVLDSARDGHRTEDIQF